MAGDDVTAFNMTTLYQINATDDVLSQSECHEVTKEDYKNLDVFHFWFGGCLSLVIAVPGFFGNIGAAYVLSQKDMRNSFNLLLIALACFDNAFLFFDGIRSLADNFKLHSEVQAKLFPWVLYPLNAITMTASILMTVAIAIERYVAVHYPLDYSQAMNDKFALRQRMVRYLMPVFFLSLLFNITKFFEAEFFYDETHETWRVAATPLRKNSTYSIATNWFRTFALGVVPFVMLVVANFKIYSDIQDRRKRNLFRKNQMANQTGKASSAKLGDTNLTTVLTHAEQHSNESHIQIATSSGVKIKGTDISKDQQLTNGNDTQVVIGGSQSMPEVKYSSVIVNGGKDGDLEAIPLVSKDHAKGSSLKKNAADSPIGQAKGKSPSGVNGCSKKRPGAEGGSCRSTTANTRRRKMEDHLASIFMCYILMFLICHAPRLTINIYELYAIRRGGDCEKLGMDQFPIWSLYATSVSQVFLVINSSINILIYCVLSSKFREECVKVYKKAC